MITTNRIKELDALRGLAALMIVYFHFTWNYPQAAYGFKLGNTGVDLFFMISGYVIFMSLQQVKSGLEFVINRFSRLFPTYWACVTITFLMILSKNYYDHNTNSIFSLKDYFVNLTMFQFYLNSENLDGSYWTMTIELLFYLLMLIVYQLKWFRYLQVIGIGLTIFALIIYYFFWAGVPKQIIENVPILQFTPLFFSGTIFSQLSNKKEGKNINLSILFFYFMAQIFLFKSSGRFIFLSQIEYSCMLFVFFSFFFLLASNRLSFIVNRVTLFFGKVSYPLYLLHQFIVLGILQPYLIEACQLNLLLASTFISLPIILLLATIVANWIDVPLRKLFRNKLYDIFNIR